MSEIVIPDKQILTSTADLQTYDAILDTDAVDPIAVLEAIKKFGVESLQAITYRSFNDSNQIVFEDNQAYLSSDASVEQVAGRVFESFISELMKTYYNIGLKLIIWATNLNKYALKEVYGYDSFKSFYADLFILSKGSKTAQNWFPHKYSPSSKDDIEYYLPPKKINGKVIPSPMIGGFQVKAIQQNEKNEIIIPLQMNHYSRVLTLLTNKDGETSYERCMKIIDKMVFKKELCVEDAINLKNRIGHPSMFYIPRSVIHHLYERVLMLERKDGINMKKNDEKIGKIRSRALSLGLIAHNINTTKITKGVRTIVKIPENARNELNSFIRSKS